MQSYKDFKKEYLNEWVDRSQVARKAAEELAMKEVKPSLRDRYKPQNVIMTLDGKQVEFKGENEKNPNDLEYNFFTYDEAIKLFEKPDLKDGWRLPTKEELEALCEYPYEFDEVSKQGIFDRRLYLPAMGLRGCSGNVIFVGSEGYYWSSTPNGSDTACDFYIHSYRAGVSYGNRNDGQSVRLVRDVK